VVVVVMEPCSIRPSRAPPACGRTSNKGSIRSTGLPTSNSHSNISKAKGVKLMVMP
jgi:hypothetical protein